MIRARGMTIKEFNDLLNDMHKVYPFKPEKTHLGDLRDVYTDAIRKVEIMTTDEETGVDIIMAKGLNNKKPWENREE